MAPATTLEAGITAWTPDEVAAWLTDTLYLPDEVAATFRVNAVCGSDLASLTDADLRGHLDLTPLQARKVRTGLTKLGVQAPVSSEAGNNTTATVLPAAPAAPAAAAAAPPTVPAAAVGPAARDAPQPAGAAPAPTTGAAGPGGSWEPDPRTCFPPADLQRYRQLQQTVAELLAMQTASKVATAQKYSGGVQQQLLAAQGAVSTTQAALTKEEKLVGKYEGGGGTCLCLCKGRATRKQAEAEAQVTRLQQQLQQQQQQAASLEAQLREAQSQLAAWQGKDAELSAARREVELLVERMFAAPAWRVSPRMNELCDAMRALDGQAAEAGGQASRFARGVQLLQGASRGLQEALQALSRTQMMGAINMGRGAGFQRRTGQRARQMPGRQFGNLAEMAVFRRANDGVAKAARDAAEAGALLGTGMPRIDSSILASARMGLFQNILLGGVVSDVIQMAAVRRSIEQVRALAGQVQASLGWAQQSLGAHQQRAAALQAQAAGKKAEVEAMRRQALAAAVGGT